ncbi:amidohydrolase family protein [Achromobacter mucicolens]|nr:amidohydrolase family protein [Achromobacter mucicolens]MCU6617977.1 amidohydrolase family protein [Achromobacter mucicolens]
MPSPLPGAAVDTHAHVFHQGLALADTRRHTPDYDATLAEYLDLLDAHGMRHGVLVQPSFLGTDNSHLVQALRAAPARLRGVAVVAQDIAETELQDLAAAGVVGIRLNLVGLDSPALQTPAWQSLLARVNALGWHVEIHLQAARLDGVMPALLAADCRIVVDHFGRPDPALGVSDPGFQYLLRQADSGRVWVKLAAPYRNWGAAACAASGRLATQQLLDAYTPERLMWGSDWPHTEHRHLASYAAATQWLDAWIDDPAQRRAVLADTPLQLFQFKGDTP